VLEVGFERGPEFPQENNSRFLPNVKCKVTSKECSIAKVSANSRWSQKVLTLGMIDPSLRSLPNIFGSYDKLKYCRFERRGTLCVKLLILSNLTPKMPSSLEEGIFTQGLATLHVHK
jgi:hypothetical protein